MTDDLNFVQKARREKLDALIERGVLPFAYSFDRSHKAAEAVELLPEPRVRRGRLFASRPARRVARAWQNDVWPHR